MNCLIVGATAGVGRMLAKEAAARGNNLLLVASDARDLHPLAADLHLRFDVRVEICCCHLSPACDATDTIACAVDAFGSVEAIFFPVGASRDDDTADLNERACREIVESNFLGIVCVISRLWPTLLKQPSANIVGFGSVAAIRGRSTNVVYSAAKRALGSYFESLRHMAAGTGIRIQYYQLGYVRTQQAFGRKLLFPPIPPERVARIAIDNLGKDTGSVFLPAWWWLIGWSLRLLPWQIFKRMRF